MITVMRRHRKLLQIGLLLVIAAFVLSSVYIGSLSGGDGAARADAVAIVNGEVIPAERYQRRYEVYLNFYAQMNRGSFTPQLAEQMGLPQQVLDDVIREAAAVQRARAEGLELSDEEFNVIVHAIPEFQESGRFSMPRYQAFLRQRGTDAEADLRRQLTMRKLQRVITSGAKVSDAEVEHAFVSKREEVRAAWALVDASALAAAATAGDDEIEVYLKQHEAEFEQPLRRRVQYVTIAPKDFRPAVPDADVEKYYTEHAREFETPRQVRAAHVLATVGQTGGSEAEDTAKAKVADVIRRAQAGEDFAKLATEVSEDPGSKANGGELGYVSKGEMVPQFEAALFALKKGELSPEPVRTQFGFHAIKVLDIREASRKSLKDVSAQIRGRLAADAAEAAAKAKADEVKPPLQTAADFMAEARALGLKPVETTMAKVDRPRAAAPDALEEAAFNLTQGGVSPPVKTPAGYVLVKALETIPPGVPPLAEIRDKVIAAVKRQKGDAAAVERARQLAAEAKTADLQAAARKVAATTGETARFSRAKPAERLPGDVQLAALQTPVGGVSEPVKTPQGYYVVKTLERVAPNVADLTAEREKVQGEVLTQKQSAVWEGWIAGTMANAKIERFGRLGAPLPRRG
ncbi:MAG TPA: peptidylprolyl isomerase [Candidatus Limnocylindria bacterium]|nr:peptidylprolyl isomerase [Candidatus Limnocylindria bacterium]